MIRQCLKTLALLAALAAVGGCSSYQLGTTLNKDLRAVYVPSVRNETSQPGADVELTRAILNEIRREGTLKITTDERAATRLDIVVTGYRQDSIRYSQKNTNMPEEYRMVLRASATFAHNGTRDGRGSRVIMSRVFEGDETFVRGTDTITAQQRCLPRAAERVAEHIIDACVSAW
jgi:hypothetical protein